MELKEYIGNQIKYYRKLNKMNQEELANQLNTTKQSISRYEKGIRKANQDILFQLCDIFNVSIDDFFPTSDVNDQQLDELIATFKTLNSDRQTKVYDFATEQLREQNNNNNVVNINDYIEEESEWYEVKFYGSVSAGTGLYLDDEQVETISFGADMIPTGTDFCLKVNGDSMDPMFHDGDYVFIKKETDFRNGSIGVVIVNGDAYLKKIYITPDSIKLVSLNKKYKDITVTQDDTLKYVGTVVF